ncbi:MAG: tail fiber protein [Burkholderiaceae bacterium]|jgi:hypothetical protein|nr:tail fiber protein [Burkholderiaceae bacterium]
MTIERPDNMTVPFAQDGIKETIPIDPITGDYDNRASYTHGFPEITMTPYAAGGKPPRGQSMNGVLYDVTRHTVFQNGGGRYRFDAMFAASVGGYPKGAVLQNNEGTADYVSLVDNNQDNFNANPSVIGVTWAQYVLAMAPSALLSKDSGNMAVLGSDGGIYVAIVQQRMPGEMMWWPGPVAPSRWMIRDGRAISRTTYAALYAVIGTQYGNGDGSTTFNIPDDRGLFIRGWDGGRQYDPGRVFGSQQGDAIRNITGWFNGEQLIDYGSYAQVPDPRTGGAFDYGLQHGVPGMHTTPGGADYSQNGFYFDASRVVPTAHENRPINRAYLPIIYTGA